MFCSAALLRFPSSFSSNHIIKPLLLQLHHHQDDSDHAYQPVPTMSNHNAGVNDHTFQGRKKKLSVWVKKIIQPAKESGPTNITATNENVGASPGRKFSVATSASSSPLSSRPVRRIGPPFQYGEATYHAQEDGEDNDSDGVQIRFPDQSEDEDEDYYSNNGEIESNSQISTRAIRELSPARTDSMKVFWGDDPKRLRPEADSDLMVPSRDDDSDSTDNVSIQALFSMGSSSFKSSTFSDVHSLQSTRATVVSGRTTETNSSTVAIPPASILDRARHGGSAANSTTTTNLGSPTPSLHHHGHHHHHHHHPHSRHISRPNSIRQIPLQREREGNVTAATRK
ncbi:hypothetical protein ZYGR_0AK01490 [Zygosaccharomyces rouxii]|uniref:Uncharacterized protein n=1 Tax=Zygosaccharomyces rouxii TaxID=4956 RepID=A0A1Q3AD46_ZYGRO|nr:hypothetical protein ZYGR_0AK01490 [Zygosaccharomyces rouxii]